MKALWEQSARPPGFDRLAGDTETDVLIIGGGIAGILCALMLERAGVDYILVEAENIGGGITRNTTAKLTSQHGLIYDKLTHEFGAETARLYYDANETALDEYRALCRNIDCDFETRDAFVYSRDDKRKLEREMAALERIGVDADLVEELPLPFPIVGAVRFREQAQFHPLKFLAAVSQGLQIFEHTAVRELIGTTAVTDCGSIVAKRVIVTTHFPFINKHGGYFIKQYQHRSYVIALENAPLPEGMYVDEAVNGMSFRSASGLLLVGGGDHRTGRKGGGWRELRAFASQNYPNAREKYHWATQDCMTLDGVPYIGAYSAGTRGLFVATGFNKWGMTSSMVAAMLLRDMVLERENEYVKVFSPSRTVLRPQLAANAFSAIAGLLTPTPRRCPHLGCALKWNEVERTWDCSCHGSRFTKDGQLIDNPATGGMKQR